MKKYLLSIISILLLLFIIWSCSTCFSDIYQLNEFTKYEIHYIYKSDSLSYKKFKEKHLLLEEIEPKIIMKKINNIRKGKNEECYIEDTENGCNIVIKNNEIIATLYFLIYDDNSTYYKSYDLKHKYEIRNYDIEQNSFKMHSMQNGEYEAEILGELIFKTNHNDTLAFVKIPFYIRCEFNLNNKIATYKLEI